MSSIHTLRHDMPIYYMKLRSAPREDSAKHEAALQPTLDILESRLTEGLPRGPRLHARGPHVPLLFCNGRQIGFRAP